MAFLTVRWPLSFVLVLAGCVQQTDKLPPDQVHRYDGLYRATVELLGGTPIFCPTDRTGAKPWLIVNGEIRFRQNARIGFNAPIASDLTFYKAITGSVVLSGHLVDGGIEAETFNPFQGFDCHYRFKAKREPLAFPGKSPFDGVYRGHWKTVVDDNAQDFGRVMNGGCAPADEREVIVRPGYVSSNFSSSDIVAAPLRTDGTFEREQGGWRFGGSVQSGSLKATVSNQTCTLSFEGQRA
jgi:hypothetical protein